MNEKKNVILLGVLVLLAISGLGYYFVVTPFIAQEAEQESEIQSAQQRLDDTRTTLLEAEKFQDDYPIVRDIHDDLVNNFPSSADIESLNSAIILAAAESGIAADNVSSISTSLPSLIAPAEPEEPAEPVEGEEPIEGEEPAVEGDAPADAPPPAPVSNLAQMSVNISVTGSPNALISFLSRLSEMDRVILINSSNLTIDNDGVATLSIRGISYLYTNIADPNETSEPSVEAGPEGDDVFNETTEPTSTPQP